MARTVRARQGETLCSLAARYGFANCDKLRPLNPGVEGATLSPGQRVRIPDRSPRQEQAAAQQRHRFQRRRSPPPGIRIVHGSPDKPIQDDDALTHLNVSNFVANRGGPSGTVAFPTTFGYHAAGHSDPDSFKLEVIDGAQSGKTVDVSLEALKPVYDGLGNVLRHEPFTGAEKARRSATITCERASNARFRSKYLRIVTDDDDKNALGDQGLLVTDMADGRDGAEDRVEILDQVVRASHPISFCKQAADPCTARVELPVGETARKRRIKLCFSLYRKTVGGATCGNVTERNIRQRTGRWFRRIYAQAELSYRWVDHEVQILDPPEANMITISERHGLFAAGLSAVGRPSRIRFDLVEEKALLPGLSRDRVTVPLAPALTPLQIGQRIAALLPKEYSATVSENPRCLGQLGSSCDVLIQKRNGARILIRNESSDDAAATIGVARVDVTKVDSTFGNDQIAATNPELRRIIRGAPGRDDRLDNYAIEGFSSGNLRGLAFPRLAAWGANASRAPLRWSTIVATSPSGAGLGPTLDAGDFDFANHPHEAGHVLMDGFHAQPIPANDTELMMGRGTTTTNSVTGSKRISDAPNQRGYQIPLAPAAGLANVQQISAVDRLRTNAAGVLTGW